MNKIKVTKVIPQEEFNKSLDSEVERISNWLSKTESPSDATANFIFQLASNLDESHYTIVGILTEVLLDWRNISNQVLSEERDE